MGCDIAVWSGPIPADDRSAAVEWARRQVEQQARPRQPPTADLTRFVEALLERWPDIGAPGGQDSPWASGPLLGDVDGDCGHFSVVWSQAPRAAVFLANTAAAHGLVCFSPQNELLMTPVDESVLDEPPGPTAPPAAPPPRPKRRGLFRG